MVESRLDVRVGKRSGALRTAGQREALLSSPTYKILLVEHRGEVFARLAADLTELGHVVSRATSGDELRWWYGHFAPHLVVCSHQLLDGSGWIAATKLEMYHAAARVWLYVPWKSDFDSTWAEVSGVESVIFYRGDLWRLSDTLVARLRYFGLTAHGRILATGH